MRPRNHIFRTRQERLTRFASYRLEAPYFWRGLFRLAKWLAIAGFVLLALNVVGYWCARLGAFDHEFVAAWRGPDTYLSRAINLAALGYIAVVWFCGAVGVVVGGSLLSFHALAWFGGYQKEASALPGAEKSECTELSQCRRETS